MKRFIAALGVIVVFGVSGFAVRTHTQARYKVAVYGAGAMRCSDWTALKDADTSAPHYVQLAWVEGFVTAIHNYTENLKDIDKAAIDPWVTDYCERHPDDSIALAASSLTAALVDMSR